MSKISFAVIAHNTEQQCGLVLRWFYLNKDWACLILREIDFLLKICWSIPCLHPSWKVHTWIEICASLNHRKKTKADGSRLIPRKHTETLVLLGISIRWTWDEICLGNIELVSRADWFPCDPHHHTSQYSRWHNALHWKVCRAPPWPYQPCSEVKAAREKLFAKSNSVERIPPSYDALELHVKRSVFQYPCAGLAHTTHDSVTNKLGLAEQRQWVPRTALD